MKKAIIGKKVGMTQIFDEMGKVIPVTVIEAGPCVVVQKMTTEKEGYNAVQLGFEEVGEKKLSKPEQGHLKKAGAHPVKHLKEFRLEDDSKLEVGDVVKADLFAEGDKVDVTGTSKGHGYAGVVKRFGQGRTPTSHGGGPVHRHAGSMGSSTDPSRIFPGKKQAGHMGVDQVTVQNLDIVKVDAELNLIAIRGAVPGPKGSIVYLKDTVKTQPVKKGAAAGVSVNPQKASARVNPQKASARTK
ncbi:MAG: 50S ribosomal protein L3 [Oscillospiraceae bacterium]|nr:50S ribosomal protein L3 [Oscillospiraceae bacterium]